ncbi:E1-E2_ATPase domain-containing protein/Cation_ATPase_N domain-containing protein/Hydrolase domain-containing protein [Cephalotus follicularis]|uniref:Magnesium-transporting ATPase, P-type 1 n=1 Tax=Cephalotus follicularis TaxID=3775 RepID=A0A1Q3B436_CEPFO|nr:E1-E2_ATPase domain-containing protein/Cation_ATPase_N domain-containing protein/Hydrolase domain-containing protein [Cephalotus follicularis]
MPLYLCLIFASFNFLCLYPPPLTRHHHNDDIALMGIPKFTSSKHNTNLPSSSPIRQNLVNRPSSPNNNGLINSVFRILQRFMSGNKIDGGSRSEEEEKVYCWLYTLAQSDKDLVFEYVRSTERGLSFTEAERRLKENGPNIPLEYNFPSWWHLLWNAFFHFFNMILIVLSALSYITSDSPNGCIMLTLVFISVSLRFYLEYSSSKAAMKLTEFVRCPIKVQRCAGRVVQTELIVQIDQRDIVPGDIVIFEPGDLFPGDVRLLSSKHLVVSQSSLTGESWTTEKTADIREVQSTPLLELKNICFMGTNVVSGSGTGLVVSTGSKTYMSTMFSNIGKQKPPDDFEKGVKRISYVLIGVMLVVVTIIIVIDYITSHALSESVLFGISVASALTPQMLPLIVNSSLAKGALAMARDRCVVKSLAAIRDMGSMDILCIDKTGTLTMDRAILVNHLDSSGLLKEKVLRFAFLNSYFKTDQKYPLDDAILAYVYTNGYKFQPSKWRKINEIPFDFIRRRVSIILETESNINERNNHFFRRFMVTKGALEEVIKVCSFIEHVDGGAVTNLSPEDYRRILIMEEDISNQGLRVLGVAEKRLQTESSDVSMINEDIIESDMVFIGLITFYDPPKDSAKQALWRLAEKGVKAKVLTGDSLSLAMKICEEVGIRTTHVTTGPDLELLTQDSFHETIKRATVLARLTPTQKLRVVQSLQTVGNHVVGFLGDGINDSLALDAANVGISVDSGASVAKDFADIILLEKDLNVLVSGVEQGRLTFGNTMKYIKMSVIANVGGVLSLLIATVVLQKEPMTSKQLLTQSFLYSVGQIAIPWDKMEEDAVKTPQKWSEKGLPMFILWNGPVCTLCDTATLLFILIYYKTSSMDIKFIHSAWFVEGLLMQTLMIHLIRTEKIPFIQDVASWPVLVSTVLISATGIAIPYTPIGGFMEFIQLPLSYFGFLVLLFLGYFTVGQVVKRIYILVYKKWL